LVIAELLSLHQIKEKKMKQENKKNNYRKQITTIRKAIWAYAAMSILLTSMVMPATRNSSAATIKPQPIKEKAASNSLAIPQPTPPNQALEQARADELVQALIDATENILDDSMDLNGVNTTKAQIVTGFSRRGSMAGKSGRQIADLFLADAKTVITDADIFERLTNEFADVLKAGDDGGSSTPVKGTNVTRVVLGKKNSDEIQIILAQVGPDEWAHYYPDGKRVYTTNKETGRDEWSVYLKGPIYQDVQIDLWKKTATFTAGGNTSNYEIMSSSNDPVGSIDDTPPIPKPTPKPVLNTNRRSGSTGTVDDYIRTLTYDREKLLAVQPDAGPPKTLGDPEDAGIDEPNVVCTRTRKKLSKNFDTLQLLNPNEGIIYPGATLYADSRLSDGTPGSITLKRAPVKLRVNGLDGLENENILIEDPNSQKVAGAINQNINLWFRKYPERRNINRQAIEYFDAYSKDQVAMNLDFKAEWLNGSGSALFNFNSNEEKTIMFVYARTEFYSVTTELPRTPGAFFDASVTKEQAEQTFDAKRPPAFVQKVDYGRLILFRLETKKGVTTADLKAAFAQKAGDNEVDIKAGFDYEKIRRETSIKYIVLGGSQADDAPIPTNFEQLKPILEQGRSFSITNPGAPLFYTIRFLDNDGYNIAKMGDSTEYVETNCKIIPQKYFKVQHRGVYISEVKVTYLDGNKNLVTHPSSAKGRTAGLDDLFNIPGNATKVRLFIRMNTGVGLVTLIDRELTGPEQDNMCFKTVGTTIIGRDLKIEPCDAKPLNPIR
jgi:hypothetical protein